MGDAVYKLVLFWTVCVLSLAGCSSVQKIVCGRDDWETAGREDARKGLDSRAQNYAAICKDKADGNKKYFVDQKAYRRGYEQGKVAYCTRENGKLLGLQGKRYRHNCPIQLESGFLQGYNSGREQFEFRDALIKSNRHASEQREREFRSFRTSLLERETRENRTCMFNSDCDIKSKCEHDRCENSGQQCSFDSDCTIAGRCAVDHCRSRD